MAQIKTEQEYRSLMSRIDELIEIVDDDTPKEPAEPEEGSFQAASLGKRAAIIFAGPLFNFILAFVGYERVGRFIRRFIQAQNQTDINHRLK